MHNMINLLAYSCHNGSDIRVGPSCAGARNANVVILPTASCRLPAARTHQIPSRQRRQLGSDQAQWTQAVLAPLNLLESWLFSCINPFSGHIIPKGT